MTNIPNNRQNFERQRQDPNQEGVGIQAQNFGGLNTVSNPLSIPYEDSPLLVNTTVDVSGAIEKRKGTRVVRYDELPATGITAVPITTALGYSYQVIKNSGGLRIYELEGDSLVQRMTKNNVWSSAAWNIKATYTATNEAEARIIFCTGVNVPVQLMFTESRTLTTTSSVTSTIIINNAERLKSATATNALCYVDGVLTGATYAYNATSKQTTVTFATPLSVGNHVVDIELITWQWWAESLFYFGDRFWDTATRFHSKLTDRHVAIPENLRDGVEARKDYPTLYPMSVLYYRRPNYLYYTPSSNRLAVGPLSYVFSDGTTGHPVDATWRGKPTAGQVTFTINTTDKNFYNATTTNLLALYNNANANVSAVSFNGTVLTVTLSAGVNPTSAFEDVLYVVYNPEQHTPAPFFVSFGSIDKSRPNDVETIYIARERTLSFNGGLGAKGVNLHVQRDETVQAMNAGNYGDYRLYKQDVGYVVLLDPNEVAGFIDFTGGTEAGVPANARIRIVNKEVPLNYVGSAATSSNTARTDGSWVPAYGLGAYANYATGSFPANVATFQGRIVFSGFPQNPLLVCMSSVTDSNVPGEYFSFFQQDAFTTAPTDPLDILIGGAADDYVTGMAEYQGSLFVFTRKATYRVSTTGRGTVTADNVSVLSVASIGLVNAQSLVKAEDTVMFLSDEGVYILINGSSSQEATEYNLDELSTKIRNKFGTVKTVPQLAWMTFDDVSNSLVVALPRKEDKVCATTILTFTTFRQAWSEWDTPGGFNTLSGFSCRDTSGEAQFLLVAARGMTDGIPVDTTFLKCHDEKFLDFIVSKTGTGLPLFLDVPTLPQTTHTTRAGVRDYTIGFRTLPLTDVQDVKVVLDNRVLVIGTDFVKTQNNHVRLTGTFEPGKTLTIYHRRPDADYPAGKVRYNTDHSIDLSHCVLFVDNVVKRETIDFSFASQSAIITAPLNSKVEAGTVYTTLYSTPLFTWNTLKQYKRLLYWLGFFDNTFALEAYTDTDVNVSSNQPNEELVGIPKTRLDCNISFVYNSNQYGDTSADLYGFQDLVWDVSLFDQYLAVQSDSYVLLKQALQGVGYSFQGFIWTTDEASFRMVGYQLDGKMKGNKYSHWSN